MSDTLSYFDNKTTNMAATTLARSLLACASKFPIDMNRMLSGTRIFYEDLSDPAHCIDIASVNLLLHKIHKSNVPQDTVFRFGGRIASLLPDAFIKSICHQSTLMAAMADLSRFNHLFSPFVRLHINRHSSQKRLLISLDDSIGFGSNTQFILEAYLAALVTMFKRMEVDTEAWGFYLPGAKPHVLAYHQEYLSSQLTFGFPVAAISIPYYQLFMPLPDANELVCQYSHRQCKALVEAKSAGFLRAVKDTLAQHSASLNLEDCAAEFGVSAATFKRKLKQHGTHFQELLDEVRTKQALYYLIVKKNGSDVTAKKMHFSDYGNFRRTFKRWTGLLPSEMQLLTARA